MTRSTPFMLTEMLLELWRVAPNDTMGETCLMFLQPLATADLARVQNYRWNFHRVPRATKAPKNGPKDTDYNPDGP